MEGNKRIHDTEESEEDSPSVLEDPVVNVPPCKRVKIQSATECTDQKSSCTGGKLNSANGRSYFPANVNSQLRYPSINHLEGSDVTSKCHIDDINDREGNSEQVKHSEVISNGDLSHTSSPDTQETQPYDLDTSETVAVSVGIDGSPAQTNNGMHTCNRYKNNSEDNGINSNATSLCKNDKLSVNYRSAGSESFKNAENNDEPCIIIEPRVANDVVDLTESEREPIALLKIPSVQRDAEEIASLLNIQDVDSVYKKVHKHRMRANRVEIVTNDILEESIGEQNEHKNIVDPAVISKPVSPGQESDDNETFTAIFSDIDKVKCILKQKMPKLVVDPNLIYAELEANFGNPHRVEYVVDLIFRAQQNTRHEEMEIDEIESSDNQKSGSKGHQKASRANAGLESQLVDEVDIIMKRFPNADENDVYSLLRERGDCEDRTEQVIDELLVRAKRETLNELRQSKREGSVSPTKKGKSRRLPSDDDQEQKVSSEEEELINNDPIYRDTCIISRLFPHRDKNEIYAYLEAHHARRDRIAVVTEELLRLQEWSQENRPRSPPADKGESGETSGQNQTPSNKTQEPPEVTTEIVTDSSVPVCNKDSHISTAGAEQTHTPTDHTDAPQGPPLHAELQIPIADEELQPLMQLERDVETMRDVFPDCDPMWLYEQLAGRHADEHRIQTLTSQMFEHRTYPKLKERVEKEKKQKAKQRIRELKLNIPEFLEMFPDPVTHFYSEESNVSDTYKEHLRLFLRNEFPIATSGYIDALIRQHNGHLVPAHQELATACEETYRRGAGRKKKSRYRQSPRMQEDMPQEPDEYFYKELLFLRHEAQISDFIKSREDAKTQRLTEARENKEMIECGCCYDDEVLPEDALSCPDGHLFCMDCIRRSSEEVVGQAKTKFPCLSGDCQTEFAMSTLKKALTAKVFSNVVRKLQEEEIRNADIPDLVTCPFCSFATIMENPDDKVFKCLNPECLRESCRLCREPNHIPLRCEEVERQGETSMRTFIENKMSEAMLRECYSCKKRFYKTEGCNKMTCTCGASMCYVCRQPVRGYDHFGGPDGCPQDTDVFELHRQEMERAAHEARERYTTDHPEAGTTSLRHDPLQHLAEARRQQQQRPPWAGGIPFGMPIMPPQHMRDPERRDFIIHQMYPRARQDDRPFRGPPAGPFEDAVFRFINDRHENEDGIFQELFGDRPPAGERPHQQQQQLPPRPPRRVPLMVPPPLLPGQQPGDITFAQMFPQAGARPQQQQQQLLPPRPPRRVPLMVPPPQLPGQQPGDITFAQMFPQGNFPFRVPPAGLNDVNLHFEHDGNEARLVRAPFGGPPLERNDNEARLFQAFLNNPPDREVLVIDDDEDEEEEGTEEEEDEDDTVDDVIDDEAGTANDTDTSEEYGDDQDELHFVDDDQDDNTPWVLEL